MICWILELFRGSKCTITKWKAIMDYVTQESFRRGNESQLIQSKDNNQIILSLNWLNIKQDVPNFSHRKNSKGQQKVNCIRCVHAR